MMYSAPRKGREATPHWVAARQGVLKLPFNRETGRPVWPPAPVGGDGAGGLEWRDCAGGGTVAGFSIVRRPVQPEWQDKAPYVVAMIDLDVGVRMLSNIVDCDPDAVRVGARVHCAFVETSDPELGLPVFRLGEASESG